MMANRYGTREQGRTYPLPLADSTEQTAHRTAHSTDSPQDDQGLPDLGILPPGDYSTGTLKTSDLWQTVDSIARGFRDSPHYCETCADYAERWAIMHIRADRLARRQGQDWQDIIDYCHPIADQAADLLVYAFDHIDLDHSPQGFYFGSHEGDGASIGIYPCADDDDLMTIADLYTW